MRAERLRVVGSRRPASVKGQDSEARDFCACLFYADRPPDSLRRLRSQASWCILRGLLWRLCAEQVVQREMRQCPRTHQNAGFIDVELRRMVGEVFVAVRTGTDYYEQSGDLLLIKGEIIRVRQTPDLDQVIGASDAPERWPHA